MHATSFVCNIDLKYLRKRSRNSQREKQTTIQKKH